MLVSIAGVVYGIALATYFVGLIVISVRTRRQAGIRGFWTFVPDVIGWRAAFEAMVLLALWPFTHNRRAAWVAKQAQGRDES